LTFPNLRGGLGPPFHGDPWILPRLRGHLGHERARGFARFGAGNVHFLPVVIEFLATVETNNIGTYARRGGASRARADGQRKAVPRMATSEHYVPEFGEHISLHE